MSEEKDIEQEIVETTAEQETDIVDAPEEVVVDEAIADDEAELTAEQALDILADEVEEPAGEETTSETDEVQTDLEQETIEAEAPEAKEEVAEEEKVEDDEVFMETIKNERTKERFQTLSHSNKELIESNKKQEGIIQGFRDQVTNSGLTHSDFSRVLELMGKANSDDMVSLKEARDYANQLSATLSDRIGDTPNAYEKFDDLKRDYEDGEANEDYVNREAQRRLQETAQAERSQTKEAQNKVREDAVLAQANAIESMVQRFRAEDPDFALKEPVLTDMAAKIVHDGIPMDGWATEFVNRYHAINVEQRKPAPTPMTSGRQAKKINNYSSSKISDEQADRDFAMNELMGR
jgi:hypothetical protein